MTRKEAIETLKANYPDACYEQLREAVDMAISALEKPEPKWIPVTERLPVEGRQVLVYARSAHYALAKYDEMREADGTYKKQWVVFDAWSPLYTIKEVIAWMPLPESYRKEGDV